MKHYVRFNDEGDFKIFPNKKEAETYIEKTQNSLIESDGCCFWSLFSKKELKELQSLIEKVLD